MWDLVGVLFLSVCILAFVYLLRPYLHVLLHGKPRYITEVEKNRPTFRARIKAYFGLAHKPPGEGFAGFKGVSLNCNTKQRASDLVRSLRADKINRVPFRHVHFRGNDTLGKYSTAKTTAKLLCLDFALLDANLVLESGENAIYHMNLMFVWARACPRGTVLFVKDADAFLAQTCSPDDEPSDARETFLYNIDGISKNVLVILDSCGEQDIDCDILERCSDSILFPALGSKCRGELFSLYFDRYICTHVRSNNERLHSFRSRLAGALLCRKGPSELTVECGIITGHRLREIVASMKGFDRCAIESVVIALQEALIENGHLDFATVCRVIHARESEKREHVLSDLDLEFEDVALV